MRKHNAPALTTEDLVVTRILLAADIVCAGWAQGGWSGAGPDVDVVLYPYPPASGRGEPPTGLAVTFRVVQRGLWNIGLRRSDDLPRGVSRVTQRVVLAALRNPDRGPLQEADMSQVIQVGLFGEVRY